MPTRSAQAIWDGNLQDGHGTMTLGSGAFDGEYSFGTRMGDQPGTNPEELIAAAHAGCFSMALAAGLGKAGFQPSRIETSAKVKLEKVGEGFKITSIDLSTRADVPEIDEKTFREHAEKTKTNCPVSQALASVPTKLDAQLVASGQTAGNKR